MTNLRPHNEGRAVAPYHQVVALIRWADSPSLYCLPARVRLSQGSLLDGSMKLQRRDPHQGLKGNSRKMIGIYLFVAEFQCPPRRERGGITYLKCFCNFFLILLFPMRCHVVSPFKLGTWVLFVCLMQHSVGHRGLIKNILLVNVIMPGVE